MPKSEQASYGTDVEGHLQGLDAAYATILAGGKIRLPEKDTSAIASQIEAKLVTAESADELFGEGVRKARELINRPFELRDVTYQNADEAYDDEGGVGIYAVLHTSIGTVTCGGRKVVLKTLRAAEKGWLPLWLKFTETITDNGYKVLDIVKAEQEELPF